ncbi:hypothetical protein ACHAXT_006081 [Thalassiosira profunda]
MTGILRSNPRYSSSAGGAAKSDAAAAASSADAPSPSSGSSGGTTPHYPLRSLADLAQRSADLSAEASENAGDADSGNVVSHRSKGGDDANNTRMSALLMTEEGVPYLQDPAGKSGPPVVDANGVIAVGVMGEDGEQVRFCEYGGEPSGGVAEDAASSRDRLGQRIQAEDDVEYEDVREHGSDSEDGSSDGDHDERILEELGMSELMCDADGEDAEESEPHSNAEEVRSFRILWELLTQRWATPATVEMVLSYQGKDSPPPGAQSAAEEEDGPSDESRATVGIGASRVAAIMSMLRMNIARSLSELKKMQSNSSPKGGGEGIDQRTAEQRLASLVGTFDPSAPAANLKMKMWKGLTTILVAIAFPSLSADVTSEDTLPPSVRPLKLSVEEYRYLTQSAIASLG